MASKDAAPRVDPLLAMAGSPQLAPFLRDDFDGVKYASAVLAGGPSAAKDAKKLLDLQIADLESVLSLEVREHHDELLTQLGGIDEADRVLQIVKTGVFSLRQTMGRVRDEIVEPHTAVDAKTRTLENVTKTVDVLRRVVRNSKLNQKLRLSLRDNTEEEARDAEGNADAVALARRKSNAAAGDLAKAAKTLCDLETLRAEGNDDGLNLTGIDVVERDLRWVNEAQRETRRRAGVALDNGIQSASQAEVGAAAQVFHNLGELKQAVETRVNQLAQHAVDAVRDALDPKAPARSASGDGSSSASMQTHQLNRRQGYPPPGEEERWAEILWQRLEAAFETVKSDALKAWHLQRVLAKKRDPISHVLFLDEVVGVSGPGEEDEEEDAYGETNGAGTLDSTVGDDENFLQKYVDGGGTSAGVENAPCAVFIATFSKGASDVLQRTNASAGFAKDALLAGYPRLVSVLENLHQKLARDSDAKGAASAVRKNGYDAFLLNKIADPISQAYLGRAFTRLSEPVDSLLSPSALQQLAQQVSSSGIGGISGASGSIGLGRGTEDVSRFLSRVRQELDAVSNRPNLVTEVCKSGVAKALVLMAKRAETAANVGQEARVFTPGVQGVTGAQRSNAALASSLEEVISVLGKVVPQLAKEPAVALRGALKIVAETAQDIVDIFLEPALDKVNVHLAAMHDEDWSGGAPPGQDPSPYAARVVEAISWIKESGYFSLLPAIDKDLLSQLTLNSHTKNDLLTLSPSGYARMQLANSVFASFTRNACLLRLGENGKLRLAKDNAELERAIDEMVFPTKYLQSSSESSQDVSAHASVRALRAAVFLTLDELVSGVELVAGGRGNAQEAASRSNSAGALLRDLPKSAVLMLAFSMSPKTLQTPYQRAGLTPALYATWMSKQTDNDVALAADATLDAFAEKRGEKDQEAVDAAVKIRAAKQNLFPE